MPDAIEILLVDDDHFFARTFIEELVADGLAVHYCQFSADVPRFVDEHRGIRAIILDIMMPTPRGVPASLTNNGLDTGLWLLGEIKGTLVSARCPVLILTNRNPLAVEERLTSLDLPDSLIEVRRKSETPAEELPKHVEKLVRRARQAFAEQRKA